MRSWITIVILAVTLLSSKIAWGKTLDLSNVPNAEILTLNGPVTGPIVIPLTVALENISATKSAKEVYLIINSPGGEVVLGYVLLNSMIVAKERGVRVNCVVASHAFSMAMMILPFCSTTYALPNSLLLFHSIRIEYSGVITDEMLKRTKIALDILARPLEKALASVMGITMEEYVSLRDIEIFYPASEFELKYPKLLTLVDNVILPEGMPLFGDFQ